MGSSQNTRETRDRDNRHFIHPWEDMGYLGENERTVAASGEGIYLIDSDGNKMIDGPAGMWCTQIGYGRKEMADAIAEQVMRMPYFSPFNLTMTCRLSWPKNWPVSRPAT